jgi:hypothetical protein
MPINPAEIKRAISLLTTVGEEEISGMEPEFFAAYARFSESYKRHVSRQIAKDNAEEWAKSQMTSCPFCGGNNMIVCSPTVNYMSIYTYVNGNRDNKDCIYIEGDIFDNHSFASDGYDTFLSAVKERLPEFAFMLEDHLACSDCDRAYAPKTTINNTLWRDVPCETIVEWVNSGKPAKE